MFRLNTSNTLDIVKRHHHHQIYDLLLNDSFRPCRPSTPYCQGIKHQDTRNISTKPRMGKRVFSTIKFTDLVQWNNPPPLSLSSKYPRYWTLKKQIWLTSSSFSTLSCLRHLSEIECSFSWITASRTALLRQTIRSCLKETFDTSMVSIRVCTLTK